uniref:Cytochrome c oxidase copper chaperone COX11 n=1 Tax=Myotis myotis TaxID=51298 RepID=A0A7J7T4I5_MYOMY|nr:cytochrome c oxidase copper chaperone COX11 [Myotis myotis]
MISLETTGLGGSVAAGHSSDQIENMVPVKDRIIKVTFNADVHASLQWNFRPQQTEIYVVPGETALAFYKAKNPTDKPVIGISTYNVVPFEAGQYFNKIQKLHVFRVLRAWNILHQDGGHHFHIHLHHVQLTVQLANLLRATQSPVRIKEKRKTISAPNQRISLVKASLRLFSFSYSPVFGNPFLQSFYGILWPAAAKTT